MDNNSSTGAGFGNQPPFLTLEETESQPPPSTPTTADRKNNHHHHINKNDDDDDHHHNRKSGGITGSLDFLNHWLKTTLASKRNIPEINGKLLVSLVMSGLVALVIVDTLFVSPEHRWVKPESSTDLLRWVQAHPYQGLGALIVVIAIAVVLMIPVGTPLTLGCGYIYKGTYGWGIGVTVATIVSMAGSAVGAIICFLLGRYLMRDQVRKWVRKYPLFDAIDAGM
jgi:membrane protein YqaA with SNARE-associated domain